MYSEETASIYNIHTYLLYRVSQIIKYIPFLFMTKTFKKMGIFMRAMGRKVLEGIRECHVHQLFIIFHFDMERVSKFFDPITFTFGENSNYGRESLLEM